MGIKDLFKSKEQKALEAKLAIKQSIQELRKCDKSLERKKEEMIKHAQEAKRQGITQQYQMALTSLKMILGYQKRTRAMILQIQMAESMRDLTTMSSNFVKTLGNVGKEMGDLVKTTNFAKNQLEFEKGMMQADSVMQQLEGFMESTGMSMEEMTDEEMTMEVEQLIDITGAAEADPMDDEIDRRLSQLEQKKSALKE